MSTSQRVNPAPALYAAAAAVVAHGISFGVLDFGVGDHWLGATMAVALLAVASASVAVAMDSEDYRPIVIIMAIAGTVVALDIALGAAVKVMPFLSKVVYYSSNEHQSIFWGSVFPVIAFVVSTVIAGLAGIRAVTAYNRCFPNVNAYYVVMLVIVMNTIIVSAGSIFESLRPDVEVASLFRITYVDRGVFYRLDDDIAFASLGVAMLFTAFPVAFVSAITFASAAAIRRRYGNEEGARIVSVTAIGMTVIAAVVVAFISAIHVIYSVSDSNAYHAGHGQELDVESAIVAGVISILGCAITAVLAGVIAWWYRALRQR